MAVWNFINFTDKAREYLTKIQAGEGSIKVTRAKSGAVFSSNPDSLQTVLDPRQDVDIKGITPEENNLVIDLQISNLDLAESYKMYQIGIYANYELEGVSEEFLYIIAQCKADGADTIPAATENPLIFNYRLQLTNSNSENIQLIIEPSGIVTVEEFNEFTGRTDNPHSVTAKQAGAVPIVSAHTAEYDMDEIFKSGRHCAFYHTSKNTLGTPYKQGMTDSDVCMILSYANGLGFGHQMAFIEDSSTIYIRTLTSYWGSYEGISQWEELNGFKKILTSVNDLNYIKQPGTYLYYTGDVPQNCPYENAGIIEVVKGDAKGTRVIQRVTRYGAAGCSSFRTLQDGSWREWTEIATTDKTLSMHIVTTKNTDLNDYRTTGIYYFSQTYAPTNIPVGVNGWLQVMTDGNTVKQIWYRYGSADNHHNTFVRTYTGSAWQDWYQYCIMQVKTVTGTTNSNGNIGLSLDGNHIVLCLRCQNQVATPYYYDNAWKARITNAGTGVSIANTEVSVVCWYAYAADWLNQ